MEPTLATDARRREFAPSPGVPAPARDGVAACERPKDPIYCLIRRQSSSLDLVAQRLRTTPSELSPAAAAVLDRIARLEAGVTAMLVAQRLRAGASIVLPRFALQRRAPAPGISTREPHRRIRPRAPGPANAASPAAD